MLRFYSFMCLVIMSLFASTAVLHAVESRTLSKHGAWTVMVDYYEEDQTLECSMQTMGSRGTLIISVNVYDQYQIFGVLEDAYTESSEIDITMFIDNARWNLTNANAVNAESNVFWILQMPKTKGLEFRSVLAKGNQLYIEMPTKDSWFSLNGSAAAFKALDNCRQKL